MKSYLFIGGAGFIGSNIIRYFLSRHESLKLYVIEPKDSDLSRLKGLNVTHITGSLDDTELIEKTIIANKCSYVFHLVSTISPSSSYKDYLKELQFVVLPTIRLLDVCNKHNVKLFYFSSGGAIYGENKCEKPFKETDALNPISYYGLSKLIIEASIRLEHNANGLKFNILRPSNPYGIGQRIDGKQGFIANALAKAMNGLPITIWGDGSVVRDYIYIEDLAKCVYDIIERGLDNTTINIGSGKGFSLNDVLRVIEDVIGKKIVVNYTEKRRCDVSSLVLDTSKMNSISSYHLTTLKDGIAKLYNHLLSK